MARPLRFEYPGAAYHVMPCGGGGWNSPNATSTCSFSTGWAMKCSRTGCWRGLRGKGGHSGRVVGGHGGREAERLVQGGLAELGMVADASGLGLLRKGEFKNVASFVRSRTEVATDGLRSGWKWGMIGP